MKILKTVSSVQKALQKYREKSISIAFVPTMGALHEGHISLIKKAQELSSITIASIFVNPTQFNNPEDLKKYPRTLVEDEALLSKNQCDYLFIPSVEEIYPNGTDNHLTLDLEGKDQEMEGHFRPGHFQGMLQVVYRLLEIVQPTYLIMGEKDFQQFSLVRIMLEQMNISTKLIIGSTLREKDGLAMSSRNRRLTSELRKKSTIIYKALQYARKNISSKSIPEIEKECILMIDNQGLRTEYFNIIDGYSLIPLTQFNQSKYTVACVAAWAGDVRLIDNLCLRSDK